MISTATNADTESFALSDFDGISVAEGISMHVITGEVFDVTAESDDTRQLELLELYVERGILRAKMNDRPFSLNRTEGWKVTVWVTLPSVVYAETSSGANLIADVMSGPAVEMVSSSGATLWITTIDAGAVSVDVSSGAELKISGGTCMSLTADISGGPRLIWRKLHVPKQV